ncbi:MAG: subtilisin family serine protease [Arcticibacterium sp.]|jgi:subtilisin family serine protease
MKPFALVSAFFLMSVSAYSQDLKIKANWFNLDFEKDGLRGMSVEKAYEELLKGRSSETVIVGVIDSGVDIEHEDLKGKIWINEDEVPGNGKDDDGNGFIDDINGWDFIGGADGTDVVQEQQESARLYNKYKALFGENPKKRLLRKYREEYNTLKKIQKEIVEKRKEAEQYLPIYEGLKENLNITTEILAEVLGRDVFSKEDVQNIKESEIGLNARRAKQYWLRLAEMGVDAASVEEGLEHFNDQLEFNYNTSFDARSVVGDNPEKLEFGKYGNNEVRGPRALHGTHVAGIIGADRHNDLGIKGVADNVKIMVVRTVPGGDERDKDVANAIRYAVDNGAQVINMSFGKPYSPEKIWVDDAVKYAESKGVLLVAAAGNDNSDIDKKPEYPSKYYKNGGQASNWITVGASSHEIGENIVADFSNYGRMGVDVFAPGVDMYSSVPDSKYSEQDGTSMASPAVVGVAALLKSYFPSLTPQQLKSIILDSSVKLEGLIVNVPGGKGKALLGELCVSGGIINAYNAVLMANQMTAQQ